MWKSDPKSALCSNTCCWISGGGLPPWGLMKINVCGSGWNIYQDHLMKSAWIWGNEGLCDIRYILKGFVFDCCVQQSKENLIKKHTGKKLRWGFTHFALKQICFLIGSPPPIGLASHNQQHVCSLSLARWWTEPHSGGVAWQREVCALSVYQWLWLVVLLDHPPLRTSLYPSIHLTVCCGRLELKRHPGYSSWDLRLGVDWGRAMCLLSRIGIKKNKRKEGNVIGLKK